MKQPVVINFFGPPGSGKSVAASELRALLARMGYETEYVPEFAKVLTWQQRHAEFSDQLHIFSKQNHSLEALRRHAGLDFIIVDSPLLLSLAYAPDTYYAAFEPLALEVWNSYHNVNFFLKTRARYQPLGRSQDEDGSLLLQRVILQLLEDHQVPYEHLAGEAVAQDALARVLLARN